ncbi:hypothetical protein F2A31_12330 [Acinetobacter suaedae]|uniref:DUF2946 domain-containing protein n=1 Tax=Acinetobacter suaedae TaxID=2609668 RepID=A0A5P1UUN3_9GAMM|nr:hypothetical protein [Acinetobacter sp. C16S1]QER40445.1 hypothetical protein F2A31_12330 [Acinetobacter sp. C16S1]
MQLLRKCKQVWFVFLMIFFIGGSSVAVAAAEVFHSDHNSSTVQTMPCHDLEMIDQYHHLQQSDMSNLLKCHDGKMQSEQHCQDCNHPSHCQSVNFALDQQLLDLSILVSVELSIDKKTDYQARHLAGYWQEILRPPKA